MDVISCLLHYPRRTLAALAAIYGVSAHYRRPKEQVAQELGAAIHARLPQTMAALDPDARAALKALAQADDFTFPHADFAARFGQLHPYRPWNPQAQPAPWPVPASPAAVLVHYGLAYPLNLGTRRRPWRVVVLPHDLHTAIAESQIANDEWRAVRESPISSCQSQSAVCRLRSIDADLFAFLSFLNREDTPVRHNRWLPPRALRALNAHLAPPDDLGAGRSELQAARIPFIHYLAERAGLVALIDTAPKPTLLAQEWLAAPGPQRLRLLWDTWREPSDANCTLWRRYRLPALPEDDDPLARFRALLDALAACPPDQPGIPEALLDALASHDPALLRPQGTYAIWAALDPDTRAEFESRARVVLQTLLTRHLAWFGVLAIRNQEGGGVGVTPLGTALLGHRTGTWPDDPAPAPLCIAPRLRQNDEGEAVVIDAPAGLSLPDRFALEAIAPPDPASPGHYRLAHSHFLHALQHGHTVEGVVNFLERASGEPLPAPTLGDLYRWGDEFERATIRQAILFQTRDPDLLRDLSAQRHVRQTLGKTLNARTVEVRADRLDKLLRRLARRGITPRLDLPAADPLSPLAGEGPGERAAIAAALRVYSHLADALGLPAHPAPALARRWSETLPLSLRDAVERTVEQMLEALHRAAPPDLEDRLPEPTGPLLETLETAIRERAVIEIEYATAGRAHHTTREVEPLRLEWRSDVVYLIAHCHLRGDQRVFRVDRITDLMFV